MSEEYSSCMTRAMRSFPKGISREERGSRFCVSAKLCSGKAKDQRSAEQECANRPPPVPRSGGRRGLDATAIAQCLAPKLTGSITVNQLATFISECSGRSGGRRIRSPKSAKNHFVKMCAAEGVVNGTFAESVRLQKQCGKKWDAQQAGAAQVGSV
jgi:hypothetical protein